MKLHLFICYLKKLREQNAQEMWFKIWLDCEITSWITVTITNDCGVVGDIKDKSLWKSVHMCMQHFFYNCILEDRRGIFWNRTPLDWATNYTRLIWINMLKWWTICSSMVPTSFCKLGREQAELKGYVSNIVLHRRVNLILRPCHLETALQSSLIKSLRKYKLRRIFFSSLFH